MKIFFIVLGILLVGIIGFYAYYGGFSRIKADLVISGGETLVYEKVTGSYKQSGPVSDRVYYSLLNDYKIETYKGFGIYYDDPGVVEEDKLRSDVGSIIEERDLKRVDELREKFEVSVYEEKEYLVAEFPYKSPLSSFIGLKVHSYLKSYCRDNNLPVDKPVMEIWDVPNKKIIYRKEIK